MYSGKSKLQSTFLLLLLIIVDITTAVLKNKISFSNKRVDTLRETEEPSWSKLHSSSFSHNRQDYKYDTSPRICDIEGYMYREGDIITTLELRCGSVEHFPCKCAPDLNPPISCPYCGFSFALPLDDEQRKNNAERIGISNAENFFCLKDGEESDPFVGRYKGAMQVCSCSLNEELEPISICNPVEHSAGDHRTVLFDRTTEDNDISTNNDENGIGDGKDDSWSNTHSSSTDDIGNDEVKTVGETETNNDPRNDNLRGVGNSDASTGTNSKSVDERPAIERPEASRMRVTDVEKDDFCTLVLPESGEILTFKRGESYGEFLPNRCNHPSNYPCYCNPDVYKQAECPYCAFDTGDGNLLCAKHEETVSFFVPDLDRSDVKTCRCSIPEDPGDDPIKSCFVPNQLPDDRSRNFLSSEINTDDIQGCQVSNPNTGQLLTVPNGASFGDYVSFQGVCGGGSEWPAYCSRDSVESKIVADSPPAATIAANMETRDSVFFIDFDERDDVVYPYCKYKNTISGTPICAKNDGQVVYTDKEGKQIQCSCTYESSGIGGSSLCSPYSEETNEDASIEDENNLDEINSGTKIGNNVGDGYETNLDNVSKIGNESVPDDLLTGDKTVLRTNRLSVRQTLTPPNIPTSESGTISSNHSVIASMLAGWLGSIILLPI
eukprot:jgi/Psemu1/69571/estExt_Genemark1.C_9200007